VPVEITFKVEPDFERKLHAFGPKALIGLSKGLWLAAFELKKEVQQLLRRSPRGGKTYRVGKGRTHKSSAPGQPPARDTGNLMNHIVATTPDALTAVVTAATGYSGFLEKGTSKMAARPFLQPTLDSNRSNIEQIVIKAIDEAIGK
jgi:phage protein, HK97 gp10 family